MGAYSSASAASSFIFGKNSRSITLKESGLGWFWTLEALFCHRAYLQQRQLIQPAVTGRGVQCGAHDNVGAESNTDI